LPAQQQCEKLDDFSNLLIYSPALILFTPCCCSVVQSWAAIDADGSRYLLSDFAGGLHLLVLAHADNRVAGLKVQTLGEHSGLAVPG
jgi:hypothetical protein